MENPTYVKFIFGGGFEAVDGDVSAMIESGLIERQAVDRIAVLWDSVHADFRLAA